jgi:hypothetical protein
MLLGLDELGGALLQLRPGAIARCSRLARACLAATELVAQRSALLDERHVVARLRQLLLAHPFELLCSLARLFGKHFILLVEDLETLAELDERDCGGASAPARAGAARAAVRPVQFLPNRRLEC